MIFLQISGMKSGGEKLSNNVVKQITVLSGKGGTGKTTFTAALAQMSASTSILADCDVDAPNLHLLLNPENISSEEFRSGKIAIRDAEKCINCGKCLDVCRFNAISSTFDINTLDCEGCGACAWICPTKAITMDLQSSGTIYVANTRFSPFIHARLNIGAENSGKLVSAVVNRANDRAIELGKGLVIVDGSPGIGCPVIAALTNAYLAIIVVEPTSTAIHDMKRVIELVQFFKLKVAVIINKVDISEEQRKRIVDYCIESDIPIVGEFPYNMHFYKAMVQKETILEHKNLNLSETMDKVWIKIKEILDRSEIMST